VVDEMACQELVERVTAYLEEALSPADRAQFDAHLAECRGCRTYLEQPPAILYMQILIKTDLLIRAIRFW
ncbi:anti-sigma factor family protein, partial [Arachidicoccus sp.]|uniref:anti-sigma factor family protein n=1 Tax=Arachidicoccus sp. TaxID=1872624 RepID=UPI003D217AA6